jgi:hypothetical protein
MLRPQFIEHCRVVSVISHTPNVFGGGAQQQSLKALV